MRGFPIPNAPTLPHTVLIAAELQNLIEPSQLDGLDVTWIAGDAHISTG
jgi:hypothetical protein